MVNALELLPHRPPMRLIERLTELVAGERAAGGRFAAPADFYFNGHFPDNPIVPAVILVEMLAQIGGLAAASDAQAARRPTSRIRLAALGPFKFPAAAAPGAWLEAHARVSGRLGSMFKIEGDVTADGQVVAVGSLTLAAISD